jgi:hypothetical protein
MSEYTLPELEKKPIVHNPRKEIIIKRPQTQTPTTQIIPTQKPISVFLTPSKPTTTKTLSDRQIFLLQRIRSRSQSTHPNQDPLKYARAAAWARGEWIINALLMILSQSPGRPRVAVSLPATVKQLVLSSTTPVSEDSVRAGIVIVTEAVPWFVRVIKVARDGYMSSPSIPQESGKARPELPPENTEKIGEGRKDDGCGKRVFTGKENLGGVTGEVEGLLIFAKRDGGIVIGREDVLREFRRKRQEWEMASIS